MILQDLSGRNAPSPSPEGLSWIITLKFLPKDHGNFLKNILPSGWITHRRPDKCPQVRLDGEEVGKKVIVL